MSNRYKAFFLETIPIALHVKSIVLQTSSRFLQPKVGKFLMRPFLRRAEHADGFSHGWS